MIRSHDIGTPRCVPVPKLPVAIALLPAALVALLPVAAAVADSPVRLAPHKAIYPLTMKKVDTSSKIIGATGAIYYEMADACRSWRTKYILVLRLIRENKSEVVTRTEFNSTENKSGLRYRFASRTTTNGQLSQTREGSAVLKGPGQAGSATYVVPNRTNVALPAGVMFPNRHTIEMVGKARAGERIFWALIFDGSDEGKVSGANALILGTAPPTKGASPLFDAPGWKIRLSYFDMKRGEQKPTYKMHAVIRDNGVTETVELDYDDFVLEGRAKHIEMLPEARC